MRPTTSGRHGIDLASVHGILETTWFLWLLAPAIVGWGAWRFFAKHGIRSYQRPAHWKHLYRRALVERDETKLATCIHNAEGAILIELAAQVFVPDSKERRSLQEAMNNLRSLRQNQSENSDLS